MSTKWIMDPHVQQKDAELRALQKSHDEYVRSSCEYERELEQEVERLEGKTQQFQHALEVSEVEKTSLRDTVGKMRKELDKCERELVSRNQSIKMLKSTVRTLEQENDDLQTSQRISSATIEELEHKLEKAMEQNVFLVQETEEIRRSFQGHKLPMLDQSRTVETTRKKKSSKRKGSYPEVYETCIHITCSAETCSRRTQRLEKSYKANSGFVKKFLQHLRRLCLRLIATKYSGITPTMPVGVHIALFCLLVSHASANMCTTRQLDVFKQIEKEVQKCQILTGLSVNLPPVTGIAPLDKVKLCGEKKCVEMLGYIDDLDLPQCDTAIGQRNITLQALVDKFTTICDAPSPPPSRPPSSRPRKSPTPVKREEPYNVSTASRQSVVSFGIAFITAVLAVMVSI